MRQSGDTRRKRKSRGRVSSLWCSRLWCRSMHTSLEQQIEFTVVHGPVQYYRGPSTHMGEHANFATLQALCAQYSIKFEAVKLDATFGEFFRRKSAFQVAVLAAFDELIGGGLDITEAANVVVKELMPLHRMGMEAPYAHQTIEKRTFAKVGSSSACYECTTCGSRASANRLVPC